MKNINLIFDTDNHFYEQHDSYTRYISKNMKNRCIQWVKINNRDRILIGGKLDDYIINPTFNPVPKPGCIYDYTRGINKDNLEIKDIIINNLINLNDCKDFTHIVDKEIAMEKNNVSNVVLYPTYGLTIENWLYKDSEALYHTIHSYNKWLIEEHGLNYYNKIYSCSLMSLVDPNMAVSELEFLLENNLKILYLSPDFIPGRDGGDSPSSKKYNEFWKLVNDNNIIIGLHANDSWNRRFSTNWGGGGSAAFSLNNSLFARVVLHNQFYDFFANLLCNNFFENFTNIKFITAESGSWWIDRLFERLSLTYSQNNLNYFQDPIKTFKKHIFISPFPHEDISKLISLIGEDNILMSSDYPHSEGLENINDIFKYINYLDKKTIDKITYLNAKQLFM